LCQGLGEHFCITDGSLGREETKVPFSWEPFWNENTWNGFLERFLITCSHSRIIRMVVYAIPCILSGAEQTE